MARHIVIGSSLLAALTASGCVINATAPISANTNVNAHTQVDQRQGEFANGSGQTQLGNSSQESTGEPTLGHSEDPVNREPASSPMPTSAFAFAAIKQFSSNSVPYVIDYQTVVVADVKDLYVSNNAGEDWTKIENISPQQIWAMTWISPTSGWIGGSNGSLLRLTLEGATVKKEVLDSGTSESIVDIHFENDRAGFFLSYRSSGSLRKTTDGGESWSDSIPLEPPSGGKLKYYANRRFFGVATTAAVNGDVAYGKLFQYKSGALFPIESETHFFDDISFSENRYLVHGFKRDENTRDGGSWYRSTDLTSFDPIGRDLRTDLQIHRDQRLTNLFVLPDNTLLGVLFAGYSGQRNWSRSSDLGKTWTEPRELNMSGVKWLKFFGENQAWGWNGSTLYRSGG